MFAHYIPMSSGFPVVPAIFPIMIMVALVVLFVAVAMSFSESGEMVCPVCQKKFRNPLAFRKHVEKGDGLKPKSVS